MGIFLKASCTAAIALAATLAWAKEPAELIASSLDAFVVRCPAEAGSVKRVEVEGQPFKEAFRVSIVKKPEARREVQVNTPSVAPLKLGDYGQVLFYARSVTPPASGAKPEITVIMERASEPWNKFVNLNLELGPEWREYAVPFQVLPSFGKLKKDLYKPGEAHFAMNLGSDLGTVELGSFRVVNYGPDIDKSVLRFEKLSYAGREDGAQWRVEAGKRIESLRKGDFSIQVVDASGKPVPDAEVKVEMTRHLFPFGSAIHVGTWMRKDSDGERYREEFKKLFNIAVFEGEMKWGVKGWDYRDSIRDCVKWLHGSGLQVRGHCLVWPNWRRCPDGLQSLEKFPELLDDTVRDHIAYEASTIGDDVIEWDVANEVYSNHELMDAIGGDPLPGWFKAAKAAAPKQRMYINDYGILACYNKLFDAHVLAYEKTIDGLLKAGAPLEGIGMQSHFNGNTTDPENVLKILDRFSRFNLPVKVTEFDFGTFDAQLQADYTRDFMTAVFSHPSIAGFLMWGFWDGQHWRLDAPVYGKDWTLKPSGKAYKDLVFGKWWTRLEGRSSDAGAFAARGFYGDYKYSVKAGAKSAEGVFSLSKSGATVKVELR